MARNSASFSSSEHVRREPSERIRSKREDVVAEASGEMMVLAVDIIGDHPADGDGLVPRRHGQEPLAATSGEEADHSDERDAGGRLRTPVVSSNATKRSRPSIATNPPPALRALSP